uniref:Amino acid transporter transmembrane domain-containing protein n=1 Tax=Oryza meridionalis TaxID=40149 RepID=A0A0E0E3Y7_9ORYZ
MHSVVSYLHPSLQLPDTIRNCRLHKIRGSSSLPAAARITDAFFGRSCLNLNKAISVIGMLYVPYALSYGRWLSLALFTMVGAICLCTGNLIDTACVLISAFLILEDDNLDKLLPSTVVEILYQVYGKQLFVLTAGAVIPPTTWLKYLSMLAYVLAVGLVLSVALSGLSIALASTSSASPVMASSRPCIPRWSLIRILPRYTF